MVKPDSSAPTAESHGPLHVVRHGNVTGTVYRKQTEKGIRYGVIFTRKYPNHEGEIATSSFDSDDLMDLAKVVLDSKTFIYSLGGE